MLFEAEEVLQPNVHWKYWSARGNCGISPTEVVCRGEVVRAVDLGDSSTVLHSQPRFCNITSNGPACRKRSHHLDRCNVCPAGCKPGAESQVLR